MRTTVLAVLAALVLTLTGCQGATTAAPTPVRSTDLTSSDGGFARTAVVGVVLPAGEDALAADLQRGLDAAGFDPDVRVAPRSGGATAQRRAVDELVRAGAKALLLRAVDADALTASVQTARDAGVAVLSLDASADASVGTDGAATDRVAADHRIRVTDDPAVTAQHAVDVVRSVQRGRQPAAEDLAG